MVPWKGWESACPHSMILTPDSTLTEIQASDGGLLSGLRSGHPLALSPIVEVTAVSSPSSTVGQVCDCRQEPFGGK